VDKQDCGSAMTSRLHLANHCPEDLAHFAEQFDSQGEWYDDSPVDQAIFGTLTTDRWHPGPRYLAAGSATADSAMLAVRQKLVSDAYNAMINDMQNVWKTPVGKSRSDKSLAMPTPTRIWPWLRTRLTRGRTRAKRDDIRTKNCGGAYPGQRSHRSRSWPTH
jgi:hypothetical protein